MSGLAAALPAGADPVLEAAFVTGDFDAADAVLDEALTRARADDDRRANAAMLHWQGMALHYRAIDAGLDALDPAVVEAEKEQFRRALAFRRALGDRAGVAESLFGLGLVHQVLRRDWDAAEPYFFEALTEADQHADLLTRSEAHRHVGFFHLVVTGRPDVAVGHLRHSLALRQELGDRRLLATASLALGQALLVAGHRSEGVAAIRSSVEQAAAGRLRPMWAGMTADWLRRAEAGETPSFARS
ncbi:tetratricopeptide repeat protein [Jiangella rhizosphaerae]|uniref:Tetratricopeptide repeat protein n=1 Tax=Jiangella rhizosphaerae TaxID=2293569 RepID=A0A418KLJ0_9ACTN|nr:tetratricopeptide repeat protein [Jiangella rhizosphaerae]RIQ18407.1 tetratricopeptide repeat protein [Jiangella rhizosphaerae]